MSHWLTKLAGHTIGKVHLFNESTSLFDSNKERGIEVQKLAATDIQLYFNR